MINGWPFRTKTIRNTVKEIDTGGGLSPQTVCKYRAVRFIVVAATVLYFIAAWLPFIISGGCAVRQVKISGPQLMIPRDCMDKVELTDATVCRGPADNVTAPHCTALRLTYRPKCVGIVVEAKPKP